MSRKATSRKVERSLFSETRSYVSVALGNQNYWDEVPVTSGNAQNGAF